MNSITHSIPTSFETETSFVLLLQPAEAKDASEELNPTLGNNFGTLERDQRGIPDSALND